MLLAPLDANNASMNNGTAISRIATRTPYAMNAARLRHTAIQLKNSALPTGMPCHATSNGANQNSTATGI